MPSLTAFLLVTILALAITPAPHSQEQSRPEKKEECGTVISPEQLAAELTLDAELARNNSAALATAPPTGAPYYLPMTIHLVHRSNGTGGLTLGELGVAMRNLNLMCQQVGIQFFIYGEIDHIYDDMHFNVGKVQSKRDALRKVNVVPNTINVYFTDMDGFCGVSSFTADAVQGVLLDVNCLGPVANPSIFAHEIGHYFDLYHTHDTGFGIECPNGSNCSTAGDRLCDTPADPNLMNEDRRQFRVDANCVYDDSAATPENCDLTPYKPPTRNLMSYSRSSCISEFTPQQIAKALQTLRNAGNRKNLITNGVRYVDPQASDFLSSCTYNFPCRTLGKALQAAKIGDFIFLKSGPYQASSIGGKRLTLNRWGAAGVVEIVP